MNRRKIHKPILACLFLLILFFALSLITKESKTSSIGVLVPLEHEAMHEILDGIKQGLSQSSENIELIVQNAQGDSSLLAAIAQSYRASKVNVIMPIGTDALLMCMQACPDQNIIGLAANCEKSLYNKHAHHMGLVLDEVSFDRQLKLMRAFHPDFKKFTLIYSSSEKIHKELETLKELAKQQNIEVQFLLVEKAADIMVATSAIDKDSQMIFVLKDHLVVSAISSIAKIANERKIPLITSDEGSVRQGASFALGIKEKSIGDIGAKLALKALNSEQNVSLEHVLVEPLYLFMNQQACKSQGVDIAILKKAAKSLDYQVADSQGV